uniref:Uncharacterized protein n=1 Tax=Moniliophthora roreri TaxID=221103 RepID=A0A0W0FC96_MONRR
MHAQKFRIH